MKTTLIKAEEMTIEEFAEKHGLEMVVEEIPTSLREKPRYRAKFKLPLDFQCGRGDSPEDAILAYSRQISGGRLVTAVDVAVCAFFAIDLPRYIDCPRFIERESAPENQQEPDKYKAALQEIVNKAVQLQGVDDLHSAQMKRYSEWAVKIAMKALGLL